MNDVFPVKLALAVLLAAAFGTISADGAEPDPAPSSQRVFYFGNSLTGSARPEWHADLAKPAGKTWEMFAFMGAGWQTWQHRNEIFKALGRPLSSSAESAGSKGDLTLDQESVQKAAMAPKRFLTQEWDAILIQVFGTFLQKRTSEMWGNKFGAEIEVGDIGAAVDVIGVFLQKNPKGTVYIYTVWPNMEAGKIPAKEELPEWAKVPGVRMATAEFPNRDAFDYRAQWEKPFQGDFEKPWIGNISRTRDYTNKVFEGIKDRLPDLWKEGRLRMVPGGELFLALDDKMKAGAVPGIATIKDFYTDVQHIRAGLANYSIAALFYASFFREKPPMNLDWSKYNDQAAYGDDKNHDFGPVLEITPERVKVVHDTIWEVLQAHPYAGFKQP